MKIIVMLLASNCVGVSKLMVPVKPADYISYFSDQVGRPGDNGVRRIGYTDQGCINPP